MRKPMLKTFVISIASVVFAGMLLSPAKADTPTPFDSVAIEHRQVQITPGDDERPQDVGRAQPRRDFIADYDARASQTSFLQFNGYEERDSDNCHTWEFNPCIDWVKSIGGYALEGQIMRPIFISCIFEIDCFGPRVACEIRSYRLMCRPNPSLGAIQVRNPNRGLKTRILNFNIRRNPSLDAFNVNFISINYRYIHPNLYQISVCPS